LVRRDLNQWEKKQFILVAVEKGFIQNMSWHRVCTPERESRHNGRSPLRRSGGLSPKKRLIQPARRADCVRTLRFSIAMQRRLFRKNRGKPFLPEIEKQKVIIFPARE
jgi:hypothetical protein